MKEVSNMRAILLVLGLVCFANAQSSVALLGPRGPSQSSTPASPQDGAAAVAAGQTIGLTEAPVSFETDTAARVDNSGSAAAFRTQSRGGPRTAQGQGASAAENRNGGAAVAANQFQGVFGNNGQVLSQGLTFADNDGFSGATSGLRASHVSALVQRGGSAVRGGRRPPPPTPSSPSPGICSSTQVFFNHACLECSAVTTNCVSCVVKTIAVTCSACAYGFTLSNGACVSSGSLSSSPSPPPPTPPSPSMDCSGIPSCLTCIPSGVTGGGIDCTSCVPGFGLNTDVNPRTCTDCDGIITGCTACTAPEGVALCTACASNFALDTGTSSVTTCTLCNSVIPGCLTCTDADNTQLVGTAASFRCTQCAANLNLATNQQSCTP